ncbi:MAG: hypothetical protein AAFQ59_19360 [Pseudomonadota bacterium]
MTRLTRLARTASTAALLMISATGAFAELSQSDLARIDGQSGIRVLTSDGAIVGTTNGLSIRGDRIRLLLVPRPRTVFPGRGRNVNITTTAENLTLRENELILDATRQRVRVRASGGGGGSARSIDVFLTN